MSRVLKNYTFPARRGAGNRNGKYPWDKWLDGRIHKLYRDTDFHVKAESMENMIRKVAHYRELSLRVDTTEDGHLVVQALQR